MEISTYIENPINGWRVESLTVIFPLDSWTRYSLLDKYRAIKWKIIFI